eukprot:6591888-Prymnesium_polylepis.1
MTSEKATAVQQKWMLQPNREPLRAAQVLEKRQHPRRRQQQRCLPHRKLKEPHPRVAFDARRPLAQQCGPLTTRARAVSMQRLQLPRDATQEGGDVRLPKDESGELLELACKLQSRGGRKRHLQPLSLHVKPCRA